MKKILLSCISAFLVIFQLLQGQTIAEYVGSDGGSPGGATSPWITASNLMFFGNAGCSQDDWCGPPPFYYHCDSQFDKVSNNNFNNPNGPRIDFTLDPDPSYNMDVRSINITLWTYSNDGTPSGNTGAQKFNVGYKVGTSGSWIKAGSPFDIAVGGDCPTRSSSTETWDFSDFTTSETVTFRILLFGGNNSSNSLYETIVDDISVNGALILPIELSSFSARLEGDDVRLAWQTESEQSNERFEVQKSNDGRQFYTVGKLAGAGTTSLPQRYTFIDRRPRPGINYYRLKQVDFDGAYDYSEVRSVLFNDRDRRLIITPMPVNETLILKGSQLLNSAEPVTIFDLLGRKVLSTVIQPEYTNSLDVSGLGPGHYILRLEAATFPPVQFVKR